MRVPPLGEVAVRRFTSGDAAGRTATPAATAAVGSSSARGLMPRRSIDQAIATGLLDATQDGLVVTMLWAAADLAAPSRGAGPGRLPGRPRRRSSRPG